METINYMTKICKKCGVEKETTEFYTGKHKNGKDYIHSYCKTCCSKERMENYNKNREAQLKTRRNRTYNITQEQFDKMVAKQENKCALCHEPFDEGKDRPYVDHNHETGKVRGLLHHRCNTMIGLAHERTDILQLGIEYLERNK